MSDKYILRGKVPVPQPDLMKWATWFQVADRKVAQTIVGTDEEVSTVFLGLNHNFSREGPPILFETMVFGGKLDGYQWRYSTWEEAEEGHKKVVKEVMEAR